MSYGFEKTLGMNSPFTTVTASRDRYAVTGEVRVERTDMQDLMKLTCYSL